MLLAASLAGCVSSHVLVGNPRPPIAPDQVHVYLQPPAQYQQIALLQTSSRAAFAVSPQAKTNKVLERLKDEAASLGANGIVLQGLDDQSSGAVGFDVAHVSSSGTNVHGVGVSTNTFVKAGTAIAIYVPTDVTSR
jgi:hypothetical protein